MCGAGAAAGVLPIIRYPRRRATGKAERSTATGRGCARYGTTGISRRGAGYRTGPRHIINYHLAATGRAELNEHVARFIGRNRMGIYGIHSSQGISAFQVVIYVNLYGAV